MNLVDISAIMQSLNGNKNLIMAELVYKVGVVKLHAEKRMDFAK